MKKIKVVIADDHTIVRQGMKKLLEGYPEVEVVGEATDGKEAIDVVQRLMPDVVIMDISMPDMNGLEATRQIRKLLPQMKILILTMHAEKEYIFKILQSGASGYLLKGSPVEELVNALQAVSRGESYLSPPVSKSIIEDYVSDVPRGQTGRGRSQGLTTREREILQLIAEGHTSKAIAGILSLSTKTVETHRAHIMQKLDIHNTAGLIMYAIQKGWVEVSNARQ
jgi:two-component system response regulator NreC